MFSPRAHVVFVGFVVGLLAARLAYLFAGATINVPHGEDWFWVPAYTGHEVDFWGWLWSQNNEHRVPLPRLVGLATLHLTGGSFSAIGALNGLLLIGASIGLIVFLRKRRGGETR